MIDIELGAQEFLKKIELLSEELRVRLNLIDKGKGLSGRFLEILRSYLESLDIKMEMKLQIPITTGIALVIKTYEHGAAYTYFLFSNDYHNGKAQSFQLSYVEEGTSFRDFVALFELFNNLSSVLDFLEERINEVRDKNEEVADILRKLEGFISLLKAIGG